MPSDRGQSPRLSYCMSMTKSWRRLAEALGPGMIDLKKFKDMDRQAGRPEKMPGGSGFFSKDELQPDQPQSPLRPPMELPSSFRDDHGNVDDIFGDGDDEFGPEDESAFSRLSHKLAKQPGVTDPDALAATIGRRKYGAAGMAAKSAAGRKH